MRSVISVLRCKKGASLILVLALTLLLMIAGSAMLVSANAAAQSTKRTLMYDQMELLAQSVYSTFDVNLKNNDPTTPIDARLGEQIFMDMYHKYDQSGDPSYTYPTFEMSITPDQTIVPTALSVQSFELSFPQQAVAIKPEVPYVPPVKDLDGNEISPEQPREPKEATLSFMLVAKLTIAHESGKTITCTYNYELKEVHLKDAGDPDDMQIENSGTWRLVSYEKIRT